MIIMLLVRWMALLVVFFFFLFNSHLETWLLSCWGSRGRLSPSPSHFPGEHVLCLVRFIEFPCYFAMRMCTRWFASATHNSWTSETCALFDWLRGSITWNYQLHFVPSGDPAAGERELLTVRRSVTFTTWTGVRVCVSSFTILCNQMKNSSLEHLFLSSSPLLHVNASAQCNCLPLLTFFFSSLSFSCLVSSSSSRCFVIIVMIHVQMAQTWIQFDLQSDPWRMHCDRLSRRQTGKKEWK